MHTEQRTFERYVTTADWGSCAAWSVADCKTIMLSTPQDASTFYARTERTRQQTIAMLTEWWQHHREDDGAGYAGLFLLTLVALAFSERQRAARLPAPDVPHDEQTCRMLVADPSVRTALLEVYAPTGDAESKVWQRLRPESLQFHRHGTTSFLLRAQLADTDLGIDQASAVKCVLYPFLGIPTIVRATREYAERYRHRTTGRAHLVHVLASADSWILMDFVQGRTLDEELDVLAQRDGAKDPDLELVEEFASALLQALSDLEAAGLQHHDLTPSNVIATRDSEDRLTLRLVDLGANYLYMQNIPGQDGKDARFAAPEVRAGCAGVDFRSDLYSLGQMLLLFGSGSIEQDGRVPPSWYARAPQLARFVEDLIDANPAHRLLVFSPPTRTASPASAASERTKGDDVDEDDPGEADTGPVRAGYRRLWSALRTEIEDVRLARTDRTAGHSTVRTDLKRMLLPFDGAPRRLWRLWRGMQSDADDRDRGAYRRWLLFWSLLSVLSGAVLTALVLLWTYRTLGLDWDNQVIVLLQRLTGADSDEFPIVDELRADGYAVPPGVPDALFGLLAFSFALVGARYYQSLFADLTPARVGRGGGLFGRAVALEVAIRLWAIIPLLLVVPPLLVQPDWWAGFAAGGMVVVTVTNWLAATYAQAVTRAAQGEKGRLSTVPESIPGVAAYRGWIPGNVGYAVLVSGFAAMLALGWAQDHLVYMAMITAVNLFQLYWVKCGVQSPNIRAGLVQACIAAERLRVLRESRTTSGHDTAGTADTAEPTASSKPVAADHRG